MAQLLGGAAVKSLPKTRNRGDGRGIAWPDSGSSTVSTIGDVFGPRPFSAHIATVGYDYDFHRGVDIPKNQGDQVRSMISGSVIRAHRTHFGWETDDQLGYWTERDPNTSVAFAREAPSALRVTGERVGAQTFPTDTGWYEPTDESVIGSGDWTIDLNLSATISTNGAIGLCLIDEANDEYVALEYDGATITVRGKDSSGTFTADEGTTSIASQTWLRINHDSATDSIDWLYGTDGDSWTTAALESSVAFTETIRSVFKPAIYWRSIDTSETPDTVDVEFFGWVSSTTIGRFGNWLSIANKDMTTIMLHFQDLDVYLGDYVQAGQVIGRAGVTGFDSKSGRVQYSHIHLEVIEETKYTYDNDTVINALAPGILPRTDVTNNVSVNRITENDPDATDSWKLEITVSRGDQDFDLNQISLTGNLATRTVNFNTRAGLNADNDVPVNDGVYLVPDNFTSASSTYTIAAYFHKTVVGTTFVSAEIRDTAGNLLWSE